MGLGFKKSIKIAPGVRVNLGKKSAGLSFGVKGAKYSINSSGKKTTTIGIPGTGLSYSTSSRKKHSTAKSKRSQLEREMAKAEKEKLKQLELEHAKAVVEEFETKIDAITTIHRSCSNVICWENLVRLPAPYDISKPGPKEAAAREKAASYKPGFFAKRISALNSASNGSFDKMIAEAIEEDKNDYDEWETIHKLSVRVTNFDVDAMLEVISNTGVFDDLVEYGSEFEIGFSNPHIAEVEFDIMSDTVVPQESATLTSTGKLAQKPLPVTKRLEIAQDYVCSCALRIARDLLSILPIDAVLIHAKDSFIDTIVGNNAKHYILSVFIEKEKLSQINFDMIDPSDSMQNFIYNMKFLKTKGFQPIDRLEISTFSYNKQVD